MEIFDLYDKEFNKLDKTMLRGSKNEPGEYHLVVHIWIRNSKGEYLIQQRNKITDRIPYQWACTGGAAITGDTSLDAAVRETEEELGLQLEPSQFTLLQRYFIENEYSNYITDLYLIKEDILLKDVKIDTLEVRDVAYKTMPEIKKMIQEHTFWDNERIYVRNGYYDLLERS